MRLRVKEALLAMALLLASGAHGAELPYFQVMARDGGSWPQIFSSIGFEARPDAHVFVARPGAAASAAWPARIQKGAILVLEGESPLAESLGFRAGKNTVRTGNLRDGHCPNLPIIWERPLELPLMELPAGATVFTRERWTDAPMAAGMRQGAGAVLWIATSPGEHGYERFPYILAALSDLGMEAPFRSARLWAFFDSDYRSRVDLDYFAARWRRSGIAALQVAAWHFYDRTPEGDEYLRRLIAACHREGILVYAWLELPHVSDKFWDDHPEWREKTGLLQDAQLDWRRLMNLANRDCFRAVSTGVKDLIGRFDWDGINLAELYFESLEGADNASRFTPMNADVRAEFAKLRGFDPVELFRARKDEASRRTFLDYRADLARRMQEEWLGVVEEARSTKPQLDLVLTHIDDRFDSGMRDALGADAARTLPLLDHHAFTFLIEDPATVWNLGAQRYQAIAGKYQSLTSHHDRLGVDINIVDRYQDVYPTKQQTGTELLELVHSAAASFSRVALYSENSLLAPDLPLLASAATAGVQIERNGRKTIVESSYDVGLEWKGAALVDGRAWPVAGEGVIWLPAGKHSIESTSSAGGRRILRLNGEVRNARYLPNGELKVEYSSQARAIAVLDETIRELSIDGEVTTPERAGSHTLLLPRGQHSVTIRCD